MANSYMPRPAVTAGEACEGRGGDRSHRAPVRSSAKFTATRPRLHRGEQRFPVGPVRSPTKFTATRPRPVDQQTTAARGSRVQLAGRVGRLVGEPDLAGLHDHDVLRLRGAGGRGRDWVHGDQAAALGAHRPSTHRTSISGRAVHVAAPADMHDFNDSGVFHHRVHDAVITPASRVHSGHLVSEWLAATSWGVLGECPENELDAGCGDLVR